MMNADVGDKCKWKSCEQLFRIMCNSEIKGRRRYLLDNFVCFELIDITTVSYFLLNIGTSGGRAWVATGSKG